MSNLPLLELLKTLEINNILWEKYIQQNKDKNKDKEGKVKCQ